VGYFREYKTLWKFMVYKKVKQSRYRFGVAQRVAGSSDASAAFTPRKYLVLIFVRG
jgi:hypothetical protein